MTTLQLILMGFVLFAGGFAGAFFALYRLGDRKIKYAERFYDERTRLDDELGDIPHSADEIPRHEFEMAFDDNYDRERHVPEYLEHVEEESRAKIEVETDFSIEPD